MNIVQLEMVNVLLAVRVFASSWKGRRVLIKCDNQAVVVTLNSGHARDPYLGACARNIWYEAALNDVDIQYVHVMGKNNRPADLLSRWCNSQGNVTKKCNGHPHTEASNFTSRKMQQWFYL